MIFFSIYNASRIKFKKVAAALLFSFIFFNSACAQPVAEPYEYRCLDSISKTNSKAKHFSSLFIHTLQEIENQLQEKDTATATFTRKFELAFIRYFTDECSRHANGDSVGKIWQAYFYGPEKNILEYQLTGANAHINGDIWKALVNNFTKEEIEANAAGFISYQKSLDRIFNKYFDEAKKHSFKLWLYHAVSLGLDKTLGRCLLHKWRRRQEKLAVLYFTDKKKFEKQLNRIDKKRKRIDRKIMFLF